MALIRSLQGAGGVDLSNPTIDLSAYDWVFISAYVGSSTIISAVLDIKNSVVHSDQASRFTLNNGSVTITMIASQAIQYFGY